MKIKSKRVFWGVLSLAMIALTSFFQNCSPVQFAEGPAEIASAGLKSCRFNGAEVPSGQSVAAYLQSSVSFGGTCQQEARHCHDGELSGSYNFATCNVGVPASCLFDGRTIAHGQSVVTFRSSTVPHGSTCQSATKTCNNGVMTGAAGYDAPRCVPGAPASCSFNGTMIAHGGSVTAFLGANPPYGSICQSETRICNNGSLSGSFGFGTCTPGTAASCQFAGVTYPHGATINAYISNTGNPNCVSEVRQCSNGSWSGSYPYKSCYVYEYFWGQSAFVSGPVGNCRVPTDGLPVCNEANLGIKFPNRTFYCDSGEVLNGFAYCRRNEIGFN